MTDIDSGRGERLGCKLKGEVLKRLASSELSPSQSETSKVNQRILVWVLASLKSNAVFKDTFLPLLLINLHFVISGLPQATLTKCSYSSKLTPPSI